MNDPSKILSAHGKVLMMKLAAALNKISGGKLKPAHVTTVSLLGHIPAAWALWTCRPVLAAALIAFFASLDALDGALARVQGTQSRLGMFFDAVTDRMKEIIIYAALGVYLSKHVPDAGAWLAAALAGSSLLVSYVKAKGEMAMAGKTVDAQALNRTFSNGIARYEVRMVMLIAGLLLTDFLPSILQLIVALNLFTAAGRFIIIGRELNIIDAHEEKKSHGKKAKH